MLSIQTQVVIVGAGPAGLQSAIYCASEGFDTTIIERGKIGGQIVQTPKLENFIGQAEKGVSGPAFINKARKQAVALGVHFISGDVTELKKTDTGCCLFMVRKGAERMEVNASKVIVLAPGSSWRKLEVPGSIEQLGKSFHYGPFHTMRVEKGLRYSVVGGGNSSGQAIITLAAHAEKVTVIARSGLNMMSQYLIDRIVEMPNVEVLSGRSVKAVDSGRVLLDDGTYVNANHTYFAGGTVPNTQWLPSDMLDGNGFILTGVDGAMSTQTILPNVFAIGDAKANVWRRSVGNAVSDANQAMSEIFRYLDMRTARSSFE